MNYLKATILTLMVAGMALASNAASFESTGNSFSREIKTIIQEKVIFPESLRKSQNFKEKVSLTFSLDNNGCIKVENVKGENELLELYVKEEMEKLTLENFPEEYADSTFTVSISFKLI